MNKLGLTIVLCSTLGVLACSKTDGNNLSSTSEAIRASGASPAGTATPVETTAERADTVASSSSESEYRRPVIRHDNYDGSQDISGSKMLEPETLNNVITNLLGKELSIDGGNPLSSDFGDYAGAGENTYPVYLGGVDYRAVVNRNREVAATMPLIMDRVAKSVCYQVVKWDYLNIDFTSGTNEENADELHMHLCSRPIDDDTQDGVDSIFAAAVDADLDAGADPDPVWQAVCTFFLLKEGSILIN